MSTRRRNDAGESDHAHAEPKATPSEFSSEVQETEAATPAAKSTHTLSELTQTKVRGGGDEDEEEAPPPPTKFVQQPHSDEDEDEDEESPTGRRGPATARSFLNIPFGPGDDLS